MDYLKINDKKYKIIKENGECLNTIDLNEYVTDYYDDFDYVVGDFAYSKVRLKGFYKHNNKKVKKINDINYVDDYINNFCAYGCKYFILEKVIE